MPYQTASELPSCGYRSLPGLSRYSPAALSQSVALIAVLTAAAVAAQLAASALSPSIVANCAPVASVW